MKKEEKIKELLSKTKDWNRGGGLIVSPVLSKELKRLGFKNGYTVTKKIKINKVA